MTYHEIRNLFVSRSGRYDLTDASDNDNGADFFLNAGQRLLDRLVEHHKSMARSYHAIVSGSWFVKTTGLEAVKEVWIANSDGKYKLEKKTLTELRELYDEGNFSEVTAGTPAYYAIAAFRPYPDATVDASLVGFYDVDDLITTEDGKHYTYDGVIFMPPSDGSSSLSIWGKFRSPTLSAVYTPAVEEPETAAFWTETASYWSEIHPDILLKAGLYELEVFYRNTEGAKDWKNILDLDLISLDSMMADGEMSDIEEMEG